LKVIEEILLNFA